MKNKSFLYAFIITLICSILGKYLSMLPLLKVIGAMVISLLLGMAVQFIPGVKENTSSGVAFISNKFLRLGIIILGFKLNLSTLAAEGPKTLLMAVIVVTFTIIILYNWAKKAGINEELAMLTACGTGICGAAAIMGISPQVKAKSDDSVLAVAIICILGTLFTVIEVLIYPFLGLTPKQFGVMSGLTLHEIAHAVAAAGSLGPDIVEVATIAKLSRVLLLAPVAIIVGYLHHRKHKLESDMPKKVPIPWFMLGFLLTAFIATTIDMGQDLLNNLSSIAFLILGMAMAALGMNVNFEVLFERGKKLLPIAFAVSVITFFIGFLGAKILF
ncbi:MAG: putative sulfate exporter family transporter [Tissierellia bacterium]|nr:putative sulfate exporter family transporter [Tissierellia bacterium]